MPLFGPKPLLTELQPMVWALIPYRVDGECLLAEGYDTVQTKFELADAFRLMGLPWLWQAVVPNGLDLVLQQLQLMRERRPIVALNFCDGGGLDGYPGLCVVEALERTNLAFTGARSAYYRTSTSKLAMKHRFVRAGVPTAAFEAMPHRGPVPGICDRVGAPIIIKPDISAASYGISLRSVVTSDALAAIRRDELECGNGIHCFGDAPVFAERFIEGQEFTVLVLGEFDGTAPLECLAPVERIFHRGLPVHERFLSYDRYWGRFADESRPSPDEPFYHYELAPAEMAAELAAVARDAYRAVEGTGYGRVDIRRDAASGQLYVLEVNANCGLSSDRETTVGEILRLTGVPFHELLATLAEDALLRANRAGGRA